MVLIHTYVTKTTSTHIICYVQLCIIGTSNSVKFNLRKLFVIFWHCMVESVTK